MKKILICKDVKKQGFTLIEILIATVLFFLLFSLVYATFFSVSRVSAELQDKMESSEIIFNFLTDFRKEITSSISEGSLVLSRSEMEFLSKDKFALYPAKIRYFVKTSHDAKATLFRQQKNLLTGYSYTFPAVRNAESVDFLFYDGEIWDYNGHEDKLAAVAVEINYGGEKFFLPVMIYSQEKNEK